MKTMDDKELLETGEFTEESLAELSDNKGKDDE